MTCGADNNLGPLALAIRKRSTGCTRARDSNPEPELRRLVVFCLTGIDETPTYLPKNGHFGTVSRGRRTVNPPYWIKKFF